MTDIDTQPESQHTPQKHTNDQCLQKFHAVLHKRQRWQNVTMPPAAGKTIPTQYTQMFTIRDSTIKETTTESSDMTAKPVQATAGSSTYYALLRTPEKLRQELLDLLQLCHSLASSLHEVSEPEVAQKKIHWWHEEIQRLFDGQPRHPDTQRLMPALDSITYEQSLFLSILEANNSEKFENSKDSKSFHQRLEKDYGVRLKLSLALMSARSLDSEPVTLSTDRHRQWSLALGLTDRLTHFRLLYDYGYPVFPTASYDAYGLKPEDIAKPECEQQTLAFMQQQLTDTTDALRTVLADAGDDMPRAFTVYAQLKLAQLTLWQKKSVNPHRTYIMLTPLKKAWLALTSRRGRVIRSKLP